MKTLTALSMLLFSFISFSQVRYDDFYLNSFFDFYSNNYLNTESSGRGFTGIAFDNDISGIILNPATVSLDKKYQLNFQYTFKNKQPWLESIGINDVSLKQQLFSGSAGFGWKVSKSFQTGFVYNNPQSMYFALGEMIRTDEFGNELGRFDMYQNITRHSFNIPLIFKTGNFSSALNVNYIYSVFTMPGESFSTINNPEGYSGSDTKGSVNYFKADIGLLYNFSKSVSAGLTVSSGMVSDVTYKYPDGSSETGQATLPWKSGIGFKYSIPGSSWKVGFDYVYNRTSAIRNLRDRHDFHIGTDGYVNKNLILRAGFFTLFDNRVNDTSVSWIDKPGEYDQYFITLGGSYIHKNTKFNLALLTSQISSGKIKNLYINGGVTFNF